MKVYLLEWGSGECGEPLGIFATLAGAQARAAEIGATGTLPDGFGWTRAVLGWSQDDGPMGAAVGYWRDLDRPHDRDTRYIGGWSIAEYEVGP